MACLAVYLLPYCVTRARRVFAHPAIPPQYACEPRTLPDAPPGAPYGQSARPHWSSTGGADALHAPSRSCSIPCDPTTPSSTCRSVLGRNANLADLANKLPKVERPAGIQRRTLINMAGVAAAASLCPCTLCTPAANAGEGAGPWEYGQLEGPKNWGGVCQIGASQSPIDVPLSQLFVRGPNPGEGMGPIDFDYPAAGRAAVLNTGHGTMQVGVQ